MKKLFVFIFVVLLCHVHSGPINNVYEDTTPAPPPPEYRLKSDFSVENYKLKITVGEIRTEKTFEGTVEIKLKAAKKTDLIRLHVGKNMKEIKFPQITAKKPDDQDVPLNEGGSTLKPNSKTDIIEIKLVTEVKENDVIILTIAGYKADFSGDMYGFYRSTYKEGTRDLTIATTQFQPTHARKAFPCLDEPKYKATFDITIVHTKDYKAISNQPEKQVSNTETTFETTPGMSTYLVAFVVSTFQPTSVEYEDSKCGDDGKQKCISTIWTPKDLTANAQYAKGETPKILKELNAFTDRNYWDLKMKKLDQVAIPDFSAGAMENWGLVTYRETALLIDNQKSTARNKQRVTSVIAHEFAHMWFGNLFTLDWWDYTWLNEGFARFFEYFITGLIHTKDDDDDWKMDQQFVVEQIHSAFVSDGFEKTKKLNHPVNSEIEIKSKFDSIGYNKGASVIRMLEHAVGGRDKFKEKIQKYLTPGKENVTPEDLYKAFDNPGETVWAKFMESWTTQEGYPLITVSRKKGDTTKAETDKQTIVVKQERFLYEQPEDDAKKGEKWQIWLTYATKEGKTNPGKMITKDTQDIPNIPKEDFLIFNVDQTGYYRVKYEGELLDELLKTLKEKPDSIPIINRAQIVDDYMNFARAGQITYVEAFKVISFLENEEEYLPWYAALNSFSFLRRRFADGNIRKSIDEQMGTLMKKVITNAKFETENVKHFEMLKKVLILQWACEINEQNCVSKAKQLFEDYKKSETNPGTTTTEGTTTTDGTTTTTEGTTTTTDGTTTTTEGTTTTTEGTTTTTEGTTTTTEGTTTTTDGTTTTTDGTTTKETTTEETTTETTTEETTTETTTEETTTETTTEETTTETTTEETTTETTTEETTTETTTEETTTETTTEETTTEETTTEETTTEETTTEDTTTEETTTTEKAGSGDVKRDVKRAISMKESGGYANVHGIVLCAGLRNSDKEEDWEFVKGLLDTKTFPQEQATIVTALGCTKNVKYLEEYLQMTLDTKSRKPFRKQDKMAVFNAVLTGNPQGVDTAFKFLENKLPEIKNNFQGLNDLSEMVNNVADRLTSKTQMNEFKTFLTKNEDTLEIDITPLIDMLETNGQWIDKNEKTLENFYKKPDDGGGAAGLTISTFLLLLTTFIIKNI